MELDTIDWLVFAGLLLASLGVGFFFAWKDRNQSADSYLLNNEAMNPYAAGLSIFVSLISALTIIGLPVEIYMFGNAMVWRMLGGLVGMYTVCYVFLPKIYGLQLYSIYTYTDLRFKSPFITKLTLVYGMGALLFHLMALSYLTALAFSTVIDIPDWGSLLVLNTVAIVYTMCGGMKAVIWTDCMQSLIMLFSLTFICCKLWFMLGSDNIMEVCEEHKCNQWKDMRFDVFQRTSSWGYLNSEYLLITVNMGFGQYFMQRCVACDTLADARKALSIGIVISLFVGAVLTPMTGMAALAYFNGKDPVKCGNLMKADQLMPYLAARVFEDLPGLTGLFISAAYSATLSTLSTGLNSFATVAFKVKSHLLVSTDNCLFRVSSKMLHPRSKSCINVCLSLSLAISSLLWRCHCASSLTPLSPSSSSFRAGLVYALLSPSCVACCARRSIAKVGISRVVDVYVF